MRRKHYTHFAHPTQRRSWGDEPRPALPLCGNDKYGFATVSEDREKTTCPACLAIFHRQELAARSAELTPLALEKFDGRSPYRFTYKAMVGGEHVGWVAYDGAYGGGTWRVCVVNTPEPGDNRVVGYQLAVDPEAEYPKEFAFPTKEAALMKCEELRAQGRLRTPAEEAKRVAANRARMATIDQQIEREAEEGNADRTLALDAIAELLARDDLSNSQRAGLEAAAKVVRKVDGDEKRHQTWRTERKGKAA